jgi:hypothetical protein
LYYLQVRMYDYVQLLLYIMPDFVTFVAFFFGLGYSSRGRKKRPQELHPNPGNRPQMSQNPATFAGQTPDFATRILLHAHFFSHGLPLKVSEIEIKAYQR